MDKFDFIAILENEFQAHILKDVLDKEAIPHRIRSYYDLAYNGLFQNQKGWGHVEAPEKYRRKILSILDNLTQAGIDQ